MSENVNVSEEKKEVSKTKQIIAKFKECNSVSETAKFVDVSYQFAYNVLSSKQLIEKKSKNENSVSSQIKKLNEQGLEASKIAKQLNVRYQFVYNVLKGNIVKTVREDEE